MRESLTCRLDRQWGPTVLRPQREQQRLTRAALSQLSGVSESAISKLERGSHAVSARLAARLCRALRLPSPIHGPTLALPLGELDAVEALRVLRQALQEFAAERYHPAAFVDRHGPWPSLTAYHLALTDTLADQQIATALASQLATPGPNHDQRR